MAQNLITLVLNDARLAAIDAALTTIENELVDLVSLPVAERRDLFKMGDKSEVFCRQTLGVLAQNPKIVPEGLGLPDAQADLAALDALRPRLQRLRMLVGRGDDTETALGADIFSAALEGYGLLKVSGKGHGLERLRQELSTRFAKAKRTVEAVEPAPTAPVPTQPVPA